MFNAESRFVDLYWPNFTGKSKTVKWQQGMKAALVEAREAFIAYKFFLFF